MAAASAGASTSKGNSSGGGGGSASLNSSQISQIQSGLQSQIDSQNNEIQILKSIAAAALAFGVFGLVIALGTVW